MESCFIAAFWAVVGLLAGANLAFAAFAAAEGDTAGAITHAALATAYALGLGVYLGCRTAAVRGPRHTATAQGGDQ